MQQIEIEQQVVDKSGEVNAAIAKLPVSSGSVELPPQPGNTAVGSGTPCAKSGCGGTKFNGGGAYPYVYAAGKVYARFPSLATEKEYYQVIKREEAPKLKDPQELYAVLSKRENRYLARKMCWVLTVGGPDAGIDTYILQPRDQGDFELLVEAIKPPEHPTDEFKLIDLVIGMRGPIAPPEMCNGLMVPIVAFDQMYSFSVDDIIEEVKKKVKRPETMSEKELEDVIWKLLKRIIKMADNAGATDDHRALNYLAVRYSAIYKKAVELSAKDYFLTQLEVLPSRLSGVRKIVDVVFSYSQSETDFIEKYFVRVDVTEEFPFLVTKMSPYYDR